jgi:hypothetical protein
MASRRRAHLIVASDNGARVFFNGQEVIRNESWEVPSSANVASAHRPGANEIRVELLHVVPKADEGSWVSLTVDGRGRILACDQYGGLWRLRDTDGDDQFDHEEQLRRIEGSGKHGPHAVVLGPDGKSIHVVCGNHTQLAEGLERTRAPRRWRETLSFSRRSSSSCSCSSFVPRVQPGRVSRRKVEDEGGGPFCSDVIGCVNDAC